MLYLLFAFLAGALALAVAQVLASRLRLHRASVARRNEDRLIADLRRRGWSAPSSPPVLDWLADDRRSFR